MYLLYLLFVVGGKNMVKVREDIESVGCAENRSLNAEL